MDFQESRGMMFENGTIGLAASIETFARFQAGFLSFGDSHRILYIRIVVLLFFIDFHGLA